MYYSYVEIEYVATSFSPARTYLAVKLLIRKLIFLTADFGCVTKKSCVPKIYVNCLLARQSHQAPRSITVPILLRVGIVRVHFLYLNPKICK
jgi:hypothetical protein